MTSTARFAIAIASVGVDSSTPVVDYRTLYDIAARALGSHTGLLEEVAERIASGVL